MTEIGRVQFSGKTAFILSAAASAVGLGNIWRFPTIAANDGGGAFLLVYIAITMTFGAVMMITEIALGRRSRKTPEGAYSGLDKRGSLLGKATVLVPVLIMPYYCVVGGWILGYLAAFAMNMDMTASTAFGEFAASYYSLAAFLIFVVLVAYVIYKGVNKGIERVNKIFMPAFLIMLVLLTIYIIAQPGTGAGLSYYLGFDLSKITPDLFLDALGQTFYSLSLAMAIMITYGSYMKRQENIERTVYSVTIIDTIAAFLAGLFIIPAVFTQFSGDIPSGPGLIFVALPSIFDSMPFGEFIGFVFFAVVLIAAITSAISIAEAVVASMKDMFQITRNRALALFMIYTVVFGSIVCLGFGPLSSMSIFGMTMFDLLDFATNNLLMPLVAIGMCIFVGHLVGTKVIKEEVSQSSEFKTYRFYSLMIKWVCPIFVGVILVSGLGLI